LIVLAKIQKALPVGTQLRTHDKSNQISRLTFNHQKPNPDPNFDRPSV